MINMRKKKLLESFEWLKVPEDISKDHLVKVVAKTNLPTIHPDDPEYPVRLFPEEELKKSARSLAHRPVGLNHKKVIDNAIVVDSEYNPETKAIEALLYLPKEYIRKIREGKIKHVSVEYRWREEERKEEGVEFRGLIFDRIDLLENMEPGDPYTSISLFESKGGRIVMSLEEKKKAWYEGKVCKECGVPLTKDNVYDYGKPRYLCKECKNKQTNESRRKIRMKLIEALGGKCARCGFSDWRALQIDHINGGGTQERKKYVPNGKGFSYKYYNDILKRVEAGSKDYQLLCANCNQIKKYENKEGVKVNMETLKEKIEKRNGKWCVVHCHGPEAGQVIKCFDTKEDAEKMHRAIMANKEQEEPVEVPVEEPKTEEEVPVEKVAEVVEEKVEEVIEEVAPETPEEEKEVIAEEKTEEVVEEVTEEEASEGIPELKEQGEKPPKEWWDNCVRTVSDSMPSYTERQVAAVCGYIWYHKPEQHGIGERYPHESKELKEAYTKVIKKLKELKESQENKIKEARKEAQLELIKEIESVLPHPFITKKWAMSAKRFEEDIKRILWKKKESLK